MRVALLLLVAANLLAFAWGQGWLTPIIGDVRQPERMGRQVGPDRLRVLGPGDSARTERAVAGRVESDESTGAPARPAASPARPAPPQRAAAAPRGESPPSARASSRSTNAGDGDRDRGEDGGEMGGGRARGADSDRAESSSAGGNGTGGNGTRGNGAGSPGPGLPSPSTIQDMAGSAAADTAVTPAFSPPPAPETSSANGASAPQPTAAPAVPFGLAEPPLTDALAGERGQGAPAAGAATGQDPAAGSSPPAPSLPANVETGLWPPLASAATATPACFDLRGLDRVRAEAARTQLEEMGATSIEDFSTENRSGYIVFLPPFESAELAQARIEQLREQGVRDIYLILDGTYRFAVSLGVFNRMDSVELLLERLRARGVEDAEVGFVNPAATRITLRVRGPEDRLDEAQMRAMVNLLGVQLARCR